MRFTMINLVGLSLALAVFLTITEYVHFETSFDRFHDDSDRIARLGLHLEMAGQPVTVPFIGAPAMQRIKQDFPEVEDGIRLYPWFGGAIYVKSDQKEFKETELLFSDANFFDFFSFSLISGNPKTALEAPNSVVISEKVAKKYFGESWEKVNPVGQSIEIGPYKEVLITGIAQNLPENSHFSFDFLMSLSSHENEKNSHWLADAFFTYFRLSAPADFSLFKERLNAKAPEYINDDIQFYMGQSFDDFMNENGVFDFFVQPLHSIHLNSNYEIELASNGDALYVRIFSGAAVLVLIMAAVNFMNLTTVSGLKRNKEVGVRKVLGSSKGQLVVQFLLESSFIVLVATVLGITIVQISAPWINSFFELEVIRSLSEFGRSFVYIALGGVVLGVLSGLYPALFLSSFSPSRVLKGSVNSPGKTGFLKNGLIVFQFSMSLLLIIAVSGVYRQVSYLENKETGYSKDGILVIHDLQELGHSANSFMQELKKAPAVSGMSSSSFLPVGDKETGISGYQIEGWEDEEMTIRMNSGWVDDQFLSTFDIPILTGRNFREDELSEADNIIINEQLLTRLGIGKDEAIGLQIRDVGDKKLLTVIGVMGDFQFGSLREMISPFFIRFRKQGDALAVKLSQGDFNSFVSKAELLWQDNSKRPFEYSFISDRFSNQFKEEKKVGGLFLLFSVLATSIGILGLLGIVSFVAFQRTKEVGIRKVLGATSIQVFGNLSRSFFLTICLAILLTVPLGYLFLENWLAQYAFRIQISWIDFAIPISFILLVALMVISSQVWRITMLNPVKSLRDD